MMPGSTIELPQQSIESAATNVTNPVSTDHITPGQHCMPNDSTHDAHDTASKFWTSESVANSSETGVEIMDESNTNNEEWNKARSRKRSHKTLSDSASSSGTVRKQPNVSEGLTVIFAATKPDQKLATLSSLRLSNALEKLCPECILQIRPNERLNVVAVDVRNGQTTRTLLKCPELCGVSVRAYQSLEGPTSIGVIKNVDAELSDPEILENLRSDGRIARSPEKAALLTDSRAALQILTNLEDAPPIARIIAFKVESLEKKGWTIAFQWLPSHCGIDGNERADRIAAEAHELTNSTLHVPKINEARLLIARSWRVRTHADTPWRVYIRAPLFRGFGVAPTDVIGWKQSKAAAPLSPAHSGPCSVSGSPPSFAPIASELLSGPQVEGQSPSRLAGPGDLVGGAGLVPTSKLGKQYVALDSDCMSVKSEHNLTNVLIQNNCRAPMASLECLDEGTLSSASSVPASQPPTRQVSLFAQPAIRYRNLGKSGLRISNIGLGTWVTFGSLISEEAAEEIVTAAFESGINVFDTADIYAGGKAEIVLGKVLRKKRWRRSSYVVTTKFFWGNKSDPERGLSRKVIIEGSWRVRTHADTPWRVYIRAPLFRGFGVAPTDVIGWKQSKAAAPLSPAPSGPCSVSGSPPSFAPIASELLSGPQVEGQSPSRLAGPGDLVGGAGLVPTSKLGKQYVALDSDCMSVKSEHNLTNVLIQNNCRAPMASLECLDEGTLSSASSVPASQPPTRQVSLFAQPAIRYRNLGKSGLRISNIGLGTWVTFGSLISEEAAEEIVTAAFESGINVFDTADIYAGGKAEIVLGKVLRKKRWSFGLDSGWVSRAPFREKKTGCGRSGDRLRSSANGSVTAAKPLSPRLPLRPALQIPLPKSTSLAWKAATRNQRCKGRRRANATDGDRATEAKRKCEARRRLHSTPAEQFPGVTAMFPRVFVENPFGDTSAVCGRLWVVGDVSTIGGVSDEKKRETGAFALRQCIKYSSAGLLSSRECTLRKKGVYGYSPQGS
ncbi:uncharacterized protein ISCGN_009722 [Ixodes scapularis]